MYERSNEEFGKSSPNLWYSNQRYAQFWQHYNTMMMTAHHDAVVKARYVAAHTKAGLSNLHGSMYLQHNNHKGKYSDLASSHSGRNHAEFTRSNRNRQKRKRKMRNRRLREWSCSSNQGVLSDTEILHSQMSQGMHIKDADDKEESMEVTEDFLKFLEQSEKHREQWKVRKERLKCGGGSVTASEEPIAETEPKEHPDVIRSREMQQLYGPASARIHAMETALQLSFDRFSTLHEPQFWPNIPINVIFS